MRIAEMAELLDKGKVNANAQRNQIVRETMLTK